jgi:dihydrofolate reductase
VGAIRVHEFMSVDGVFEEPSWTFDYGFHPDMGARIGAMCEASDAILLGRTTYEHFAPAWSVRSAEDDPGAPFFNDTPKYVVSSTMTAPTPAWQNSQVLGPYDPAAIQRLKDDTGGIFVSGSGTLVRAMLADGLVDELHLCVYPLMLGSARPRLFGDDGPAVKMALGLCESYDNGVVYLRYDAAG